MESGPSSWCHMEGVLNPLSHVNILWQFSLPALYRRCFQTPSRNLPARGLSANLLLWLLIHQKLQHSEAKQMETSKCFCIGANHEQLWRFMCREASTQIENNGGHYFDNWALQMLTNCPLYPAPLACQQLRSLVSVCCLHGMHSDERWTFLLQSSRRFLWDFCQFHDFRK